MVPDSCLQGNSEPPQKNLLGPKLEQGLLQYSKVGVL